MEVVNLKDYANRNKAVPLLVIFRSGLIYEDSGQSKIITIQVRVENGDVVGIVNSVQESGGIGKLFEDGSYYFIPWPCGVIEIKNVE